MSSEKQEYPGSFYVLADKNAHEASAVLSISSWSWKELEDPGLWRAALVEMIGGYGRGAVITATILNIVLICRIGVTHLCHSYIRSWQCTTGVSIQ
jgi:hypothetical protein